MSEERDTINALGAQLLGLMGPKERSVTLHPGSADTPNGSISATVNNGIVSHTSEAVGLYDALHMARREVEIQTGRLLKGDAS